MRQNCTNKDRSGYLKNEISDILLIKMIMTKYRVSRPVLNEISDFLQFTQTKWFDCLGKRKNLRMGNTVLLITRVNASRSIV